MRSEAVLGRWSWIALTVALSGRSTVALRKRPQLSQEHDSAMSARLRNLPMARGSVFPEFGGLWLARP